MDHINAPGSPTDLILTIGRNDGTNGRGLLRCSIQAEPGAASTIVTESSPPADEVTR